MPTYVVSAAVRRALRKLTKDASKQFLEAVQLVVAWLREYGFDPTKAPPSLRLHKLSGHDAWSISFGDGMRAVFKLGAPVKDGEVHIVWEFIGTHDEYERIY